MAVRKRPALTRIELLLVLVLIAVGSGLLLPACMRARDGHGTSKSLHDLKLMALTVANCNDTYKRLPPAWGEFPPRSEAKGPQKTARATLHVWLMPFAEQGHLFVPLTQAPPEGKNSDEARRVWRLALISEVVSPYVSPLDFTTSDGTVTIDGTVYGVQTYAANIRVFGPLSGNGAQPGVEPAADAFDGGARIPDTFKDGTSNTIIFATRYGQCGTGGSTWSQPGSATLASFGGNSAFFGSNISATLNATGDNASGDNTTFQVTATQPGGSNPCNPIYAQSFGS
jgi:Protein of unknown function (DUF1559)